MKNERNLDTDVDILYLGMVLDLTILFITDLELKTTEKEEKKLDLKRLTTCMKINE